MRGIAPISYRWGNWGLHPEKWDDLLRVHIPVRGKGRFIDKHFDSEFHLPFPKRWCCGAHVKRRAWVKATARPGNREGPPPQRFHSASYPPVTLLGEAAEWNKKNSCFPRLKSLEPTSLPLSAAHQNSILSSFKEKQPSLLHLFIINRRRLHSQEFHFSLLRTSSLQGRLWVVTVQTKRTIFLTHPHGPWHPSIQDTFIHHPCPEGSAVSINLPEPFPVDEAAGIHKEGEVQAMTTSLVYPSWPDACL